MAAEGLRPDGQVRASEVGGAAVGASSLPGVRARAIPPRGRRSSRPGIHEPELDRSGGPMNRPMCSTRCWTASDRGSRDGIVVYMVDRFARSLLRALSTLEEIANAGGSFASVSDNVDLTTAQGRAFLQMQLVFAQLFRDQIREGFATATSRAIARGVHIANSVPPRLAVARFYHSYMIEPGASDLGDALQRAAGVSGSELESVLRDTAQTVSLRQRARPTRPASASTSSRRRPWPSPTPRRDEPLPQHRNSSSAPRICASRSWPSRRTGANLSIERPCSGSDRGDAPGTEFKAPHRMGAPPPGSQYSRHPSRHHPTSPGDRAGHAQPILRHANSHDHGLRDKVGAYQW